MPSLAQDKQALDWLADNPTAPEAPAVAQKLGVMPEDVEAWKWAKDNAADMRAIQVRNKVFDVVAESRPSETKEQGGEIKKVAGVDVPTDRLIVKNLLDNDPEAQKAYFEKKGFRTRISTKGDLQVKAPGDSYYKAIDPEGIDKWDAGDILTDIGAGVATGVKAVGPMGFVAGGAASGAFELGKQAVAKAAGVRDNYNPAEVVQQTMLGVAVPVAIHGLGAGLKGAGKAIGKISGTKVKPNADEIEAATKLIGGKATPAQLVDSRLVNRAELTQWETPGRLGGTFLRKQIQNNIDAAKQTAAEVVGNISQKEGYELGNEFGEALSKKVAEKVAPAESIYRKWGEKFKDVVVDKEPVRFEISKLSDEFKMDSAVTTKLQQFYKISENVQNLDDLKKLRTAVGGEMRETRNPEVKRALGDLYVRLRDVRSQSLMNMADAEGAQIGAIAKREIEAADKTYATVLAELENVIGDRMKGSPGKRVEEFLKDIPALERMKKIINTNDVDQIAKFKNDFPDAFEFLRDQKVQEIARKAMDPQGKIDPKKLIAVTAEMPTGTKAILFGDDAPQKLKALETYIQSLPSYKDHPNPSKTSFNQVMLSLVKGGIDQLMSFKRSATYNLLSKAVKGEDFISTTGQAAQTRLGIGAAATATQAGYFNPILPKPLEGGQ